jgi:hypothetical protein
VPAERSRRYEKLARRAAAHERELAAERERELHESAPDKDATDAERSKGNLPDEQEGSG